MAHASARGGEGRRKFRRFHLARRFEKQCGKRQCLKKAQVAIGKDSSGERLKAPRRAIYSEHRTLLKKCVYTHRTSLTFNYSQVYKIALEPSAILASCSDSHANVLFALRISRSLARRFSVSSCALRPEHEKTTLAPHRWSFPNARRPWIGHAGATCRIAAADHGAACGASVPRTGHAARFPARGFLDLPRTARRRRRAVRYRPPGRQLRADPGAAQWLPHQRQPNFAP